MGVAVVCMNVVMGTVGSEENDVMSIVEGSIDVGMVFGGIVGWGSTQMRYRSMISHR